MAACSDDGSPTVSDDVPTSTSSPTEDTPSTSDMFFLGTLIGKTLLLTDIDDNSDETQFIQKTGISARFSIEDNKRVISGYSGCNTYSAGFEASEDFLYIEDIARTKMICIEDGVSERETEYLDALSTAYNFHFENDGESLMIIYGLTTPCSLTFEVQPEPTQEPSPTKPVHTPTPTKEPLPAITDTPAPDSTDTADGILVSLYIASYSPNICEFPVYVGFYPEGSSDDHLTDINATTYYFKGTTKCSHTEGGLKAMITVGPINPGVYDITISTSTSLINVKRSVRIQ